MQAGGWDAPHTRTSTRRAQDFTEDSRAIERFIKQKETSVCRLGAHEKSGKWAGRAGHKSGPTPSPSALQKLGLPYKEYLPSSLEEPGENRPHSGGREHGGGVGVGGKGTAWRPGVLTRELGVGWPRPRGRAAGPGALCTKDWGTQRWAPNSAASYPALKSWLVLPIITSVILRELSRRPRPTHCKPLS